MKTLIGKELRENFKLAVLGLVVFTVLAAGNWRYYSSVIEDAALGLRSAANYSDRLQPVTASVFLVEAGWLCALFGAVLGWVQIHNEKHRDLWAFLVHRPTTRTRIFFGKIIAGLMIYLAAAGLPLAGFVAWTAVPGNVAAPFQWSMVLPLATYFFGGIVYYFAGMLTGLRQARWYASRALGLPLAILVSFAMVIWPSDRLRAVALTGLFVLASVFMLAAAVWGAFHTQGQYRGQPALGKLGLTAVLTLGAGVVLFVVTVVVVATFPKRIVTERFSNYVMAKDGTVYKESAGGGKPAEYLDLEGNPVKDLKSGNLINREEFYRLSGKNYLMHVNFGRGRSISWNPQNLFSFWQETPKTLWFYWNRYGRFAAYDVATRRLIGSIGPNGFSRDLAGTGERFHAPDYAFNFWLPSSDRRIMRTDTALYQFDLQDRIIKPFFTATNGDTIGAVKVISLKGDWDYTVVVTRQFIHLLTPDGKVVWKTPYGTAYPDYKDVWVYFLEPADRFALWLAPTDAANKKAKWKLPTRVTWFARDQGMLRSADLPPLSVPKHEHSLIDKTAPALVPPGYWVLELCVVRDWQEVRQYWRELPWKMMLISLATAVLIWVPAGWWLCRRYHFTVGAQLGWAVFHLVCGVPGFLAFLSVQEWPVREPCPNCRKLRVVDREHCEHCGSGFAPPEPTGTEIFAPLKTADART
jgi:ABC-type transport system involved in multi-copper enzyme maturation permease subunit